MGKMDHFSTINQAIFMATVPVWPKLVKTVWTKNTKGASTLCSLGKPAPPHLTSIFNTTSVPDVIIHRFLCLLFCLNHRKLLVKGKNISDIGRKYGSSSYPLYGFVLSIPAITSWLPSVYMKWCDVVALVVRIFQNLAPGLFVSNRQLQTVFYLESL